jgi:hypothetical protein
MPFRAWRWDAEHGLASIFLSSERNAGRRGGWFPAVAPPSKGKPCRGGSFLLPCCGCSGGEWGPVLCRLGEGLKVPLCRLEGGE